MLVNIRHASREDGDAIAEIYNHGIADGNATFDEFPVSKERYSSFFEAHDRTAMLVAVADEQVVGWTAITPISDRWAYRYTCLGSFFVHREFRGNKIGSVLKAAQIEEAIRLGYHSLIVEVLSTNIVSVSINLSFGFRVVGEIWEAGYRDGKWIGLITMQKILKP
jgi:phosphinothricin acetyltransferase